MQLENLKQIKKINLYNNYLISKYNYLFLNMKKKN